MPKPTASETESEFVDRCIPIVLDDGSAENADEADAMCHSIWEQNKAENAISERKARLYAVKSGFAEAAIKSVDSVGRIVTGFYNAFNYYDSTGDVLLPGCSKKTINDSGPLSNATAKIKHAIQHDLSKLPGKIITLDERTIDGVTGIYFETKMSDSTLGRDTLINYMEKIYDNHSIGYQYLQVERIDAEAKTWKKFLDQLINPKDAEDNGYMYLVKEIQLYEGSTVAFGANELTPFLGIKSGNADSLRLALHEKVNIMEKCLRSGEQSDDMMKSIELQALQFKQMINELTHNLPLKHDTFKKAVIKDEGTGKATVLDYEKMAKCFSL